MEGAAAPFGGLNACLHGAAFGFAGRYFGNLFFSGRSRLFLSEKHGGPALYQLEWFESMGMQIQCCLRSLKLGALNPSIRQLFRLFGYTQES